MAITWGSIFGSDNKQGRFGREFIFTETDTTYTVTAIGYFQTRYRTTDSGNTFYYDWDSYAHTSLGAKSISHGSNTSWSSSNITKLGSWSKTFTKKETAQTQYFSLRCTNVEYGGGSGSDYFAFTVPALSKYKVTFNGNGGSGAPEAQEKRKGETIVLSGTIPVLEGFEFMGWGTSADDEEADYMPGDAYSLDANITLYAIWREVKEMLFLNQNGAWNKGKVVLDGKSGIPWININGTWRKGGA